MVPNGDLHQINIKLTRLLTHDEEQDRYINKMITQVDKHLDECAREKRNLNKEITEVRTMVTTAFKIGGIGGAFILADALKDLAVTFFGS